MLRYDILGGPFFSPEKSGQIGPIKDGSKSRIRRLLVNVINKLSEYAFLVYFSIGRIDQNCYSKSLKVDKIATSKSLESRDQKLRRESQWTKIVTACTCHHMITSFKTFFLAKKGTPIF